MVVEDNQPTAEQVKAANEAELARWEDDFPEKDLKVPFSRDDKEDDKKTDDEGDDKGDKDGEELEAPEDIDYTEPEPIVKTEDPGEFKPGDYSFTVETLDGVKTKITSPEQAEEYADANADNLSASQQIKLVRNATTMESKLAREQEKWDTQKAKFDSESQVDQERQDNIQNFANEIQYMITKGLLPAIPTEYATADWSDPDVAKQPGVKEQIELVNYMTKENNVRAKVGVKPFASMIDAYNDMVREQGKDEKKESKERSDKARKEVAAKVTAPSASSEGIQAPKGIAVGNPNVFKRNSAIWE